MVSSVGSGHRQLAVALLVKGWGLMPIGTFLLADIGGYTSFLSDVGIEHAKEITSHLFNGLHAVDPDVWQVGNVEGDCLFLYCEGPAVATDAFRHVTRLYERFCEGIEEVVAGSTCRCGACDRSGALTIKFVVHSGEFDTQEVVGRTELIGPDIVVAHRLLKNSVPVGEYAILTPSVAGSAAAGDGDLRSAVDVYPDIGTVEYGYVDLAPVKVDWRERRQVFLTPETADVHESIEIDAPPELVWRLLLDLGEAPGMYPTLIELETLIGEGFDVGSVHTCFHGDIGRNVHLVIARDEENRRTTHVVSSPHITERIYQTFECLAADTGGTMASVLYSFDPDVDPPDDATKELVLAVLGEHAVADCAGLKRRAEELAASADADPR